MKKIILLGCTTFLLISCSTNHTPETSLLSTKNIKSQFFSIDPLRDTVILGLRGGFFKIEKESFEGNGNVDIEIKEIYSPAEIIYAGLTTESDGRLLESGGMIYFNATRQGKQLSLGKPVSISIPSNYLNKEMQLFKGEEKPDGSVNWVDPEPLDSSINYQAIDTAQNFFYAKCSACHSIFKDGTGPALAGVEERVNDKDILRAFIRNPGKVMMENFYFQCQKNRFGSVMTGFDLTDNEIDQILAYIKNETEKRPDLTISINTKQKEFSHLDSSDFLGCIPAPCGFDTIYIDTTTYEYANANMMSLREEATKADSMDYLYKKPDSLEAEMRSKGFVDVLSTEGRYNFRIKTLGWFNVDAFYEGMKGTEIVDLFVKPNFEEREKLDVHVFFPAKKLLTVGVFHKEDSLFHFEKYKGQIPLFLNDDAVAFAVTSIKEKIYYGITTFRVSKKQVVELEIKETTKESLTQAFKEMKLDGIDLDVITKKRLILPKNFADTIQVE